MRIFVRYSPLFAFLFVLLTLTSCSAAQVQSSAQWTTHTDPSGFTVNTPPGWSVAKDSKQGRITLHGSHGEQIVVWPIFIEQKQLNSAAAAQLVMQLARQLDGNLPWTPASAQANAARVVARGSQRSGATLMTWSNGPTGATVTLYALEASADIYRTSTGTFSKILQSFHEVADTAAVKPGANANSGPLTYVSWSDPQEGAFTVQVPRGWQVVGGAFHLGATDVRSSVTMMSPDGQMRIFMGDANIGGFIGPSQMLARAGMREGGYYSLGDGSKLQIRGYMTGQQFARAYVQYRLAAQCSDVQVQSNNDRQDLTPPLLQAARNQGITSVQITAGDVVFSCSGKNGSLRGHIYAATELPMPGRNTIWDVPSLNGYLAAPGREQDAESILQHVVQSRHISPEWQARAKEISDQAVAASNARSQQIQAHAMAAIQENERQTTDMINKGYQYRSQVNDEVSRRRENAILGTSDVIDPATGTQYKVDSLSDYHWMNNQGVVVGNDTGANPGYGWSQMITLP